MAKFTFTDEEVRVVCEAVGVEFKTNAEVKEVVGFPTHTRGWETNPWLIKWTGELTMDELGSLEVLGITNLSELLGWHLLNNRRSGVIGEQISEYTPNDFFGSIGKKAGMKVVITTGYSPASVNFVPDFTRRGEIEFVKADDKLALHEALTADPIEEPVVVRKSDLVMLLSIAKNAGDPTGVAEEVIQAIEAALQ